MNFIICDDNEKISENVVNIVDKLMMKNKLEYKLHVFHDYDKKFIKIIDNPLPNKVYILDIETPSGSGIDIAREIRINDINSIIIFLTSHNELGSELLHDELMFLTFIPKLNNMKSRLESAINKAIRMTNTKQAIRIENKGVIYTIPMNDILYITTDQIERKSIIVTSYNEFHISMPLHNIYEMLNDNFVQTHRSCYINMLRTVVINKRKNTILFDNNTTIDLLSDSYKKGIK